MEKIFEQINYTADFIFTTFFLPLLTGVSDLLCFIMIAPMIKAGIPPAIQIAVVGALTALLSIMVRRWTSIERHENDFNNYFQKKLSLQQDINKLSDWKIRKLMIEASDNELDEAFNEYISGKYARYATTYILPVTAGEIWINNIFSESELLELHGATWVLPLPANSFGIGGISASALFLLVYLISLLMLFIAGKKFRRHLLCRHKKSPTS